MDKHFFKNIGTKLVFLVLVFLFFSFLVARTSFPGVPEQENEFSVFDERTHNKEKPVEKEDPKEGVTTEESKTEEQAVELDEVQLVRVVDGDTLLVNKDGVEVRVRLLEVDTPESVHVDASKNNEFGEMASAYTKKLLENVDTLYLSYDKEKVDQYGRTLAYVWLSNDTSDVVNNCLNAKLLQDGMAQFKVFGENDLFSDEFSKLEQTAKDNMTGIWQYEEFWSLMAQ